MRTLRYLRHLLVSFFIGTLVFFAPLLALTMFIIIGTPFLLSFLAGCWAALFGLYWLGMHHHEMREPALILGGMSIALFGVGWVFIVVLFDIWDGLKRLGRPNDESLEMSLESEPYRVR